MRCASFGSPNCSIKMAAVAGSARISSMNAISFDCRPSRLSGAPFFTRWRSSPSFRITRVIASFGTSPRSAVAISARMST